MAQTKSGSSRGAAAKKSTAKKSAGSSRSSAAKKTGGKNAPVSTARKGTPPAPAEDDRRPVRREIGAAVLLFFALVAFICYFNVDAWLLTAFRNLCLGLFGWGFYIMCPALLLAAGVLGFHHGRPVKGRLICALLLPMVFGAFIHLILCADGDYLAGDFKTVIVGLWEGGLLSYARCGGVLSGLLSEGLEYAISVYGAGAVLLAVFFTLLFVSLRVTMQSVREHAAARPRYRPEYYDAPDDDDFTPLDFFSLPKEENKAENVGPRSRFGLFDIPLDDDGPGPETLRPEKPARGAVPAPEEPKPETEPVRERSYKPMKKNARSAPRATMSAKKPPKGKTELFDFEKEDEDEPFTAVPPAASPAMSAAAADVEPVSLEEAAAIAGVQINSAEIAGPAADKPKTGKLTIDRELEAARVAEEIAQNEQEDKPEYTAPPLELLNVGKPARKGDAQDEIDKNRERLESTIRSFGVSARITDVTRGPTVTRYDLELSQGVKLNKVTNLAGDIALSLGVVSVRIAPIPDKISTVGVEVPNRNVATVWLRELIASPAFEKAPSKLSFAIGKDIGGNAIVGNIAKLPHLLIAGTTGSGKSVCINSLILSLLYKSTPDEVRMIMIDPKMVELGIYNGMPHLYVPVVTDPKKAAGALQWSVVEMLKRYRLFSEVGVRDLAGYNAYQRRHDQPTLPQVVIIIDELADLMLVASKEVEESICRVAQMGRASGMHLVIATQRPSADVITGLMKANIPSRIAFAVSSALESRIIIDQAGADKLIGQGDMLYCPLGIGKPMRVQGAFVSDEERERVVEFVKKDAEATYSDEILAEIEKAAAAKSDKGSRGGDDEPESAAGNDYDELLPDAVDVVLELKQASVSSLQRKLKLGYSRAARIVDQMEQLGVVGPYEGSKPRKVLITRQQWQQMQYSTGVAPADSIAAEFADVADDAEFAELPDTAEEAAAYETEEESGEVL